MQIASWCQVSKPIIILPVSSWPDGVQLLAPQHRSSQGPGTNVPKTRGQRPNLTEVRGPMLPTGRPWASQEEAGRFFPALEGSHLYPLVSRSEAHRGSLKTGRQSLKLKPGVGLGFQEHRHGTSWRSDPAPSCCTGHSRS